MNTVAKQLIRASARKIGFEVSRFSESPYTLLVRWMEEHRVTVVVDVGAHAGQFALAIREAGHGTQFRQRRIISFEPLSEPFRLLSSHANLSHGPNPFWILHQCAIGNRSGDLTIHVSSDEAGSSSALPLTHEKFVHYVGEETVPLKRLDEFRPEILESFGDVPFLKIDVQGFETHVLEGAKELLPKVVGLHIEMSLVPLYEGQELFPELLNRLAALGFTPWAFFPTFTDPHSGRMLQVDGVFFRD